MSYAGRNGRGKDPWGERPGENVLHPVHTGVQNPRQPRGTCTMYTGHKIMTLYCTHHSVFGVASTHSFTFYDNSVD